jgi:HTH-type transcriptional regulator / antitoxin HipB
MIQNDRQYEVTQTKLRELDHLLAAIDPEDSALHPRLIISRTNSYNFWIRKLKQEIEKFPDRFSPRSAPSDDQGQDCCGHDSEGTR